MPTFVLVEKELEEDLQGLVVEIGDLDVDQAKMCSCNAGTDNPH